MTCMQTHMSWCGFITFTVITVPFMAVPGFNSILVEEFPGYVRDMMQNKEDKLQAEFVVCFLFTVYCVHGGINIEVVYFVGSGKATSTTIESGTFAS